MSYSGTQWEYAQILVRGDLVQALNGPGAEGWEAVALLGPGTMETPDGDRVEGHLVLAKRPKRLVEAVRPPLVLSSVQQ